MLTPFDDDDDDGAFNMSYIVFEIYVSRRPEYYMVTVFFPSTLLTLLSGMVFWLPPDSGEKLSYSISIMLGLTVFQVKGSTCKAFKASFHIATPV